jgi:hypothetical protein
MNLTDNQVTMLKTDAKRADRGLLGYLYGVIKREGDPDRRPIVTAIIRAEIASRVVGPRGNLP